MVIRYAELMPDQLRFSTDSSLTNRMIEKLRADVEQNGFKNPISVKYDGTFYVTWGRSRAYIAKLLDIPVPAIIFEAKPCPVGVIIDDPAEYFESPCTIKPWRYAAAPLDKFWT